MKYQNIDKKVLITRDIPEIGIDLLRNAGFKVTTTKAKKVLTQPELFAKSKKHDALLCTVTEKIDRDFFLNCPSIRIISQYGVGYDNIDIDEATHQGIPIGFTPDAMNNATADIAFGLMIAVARNMFQIHKSISNGEWDFFKPRENRGLELMNKTIGVFGLGRIGYEMAKRCKRAYDMNIIYHNRKANFFAEQTLNAKYVSFDYLLKNSDVISIHCSLTNETLGIFNKMAFRKMKNTAIFINTARGPIHNETDLINAITIGSIWGAGLDVTNPEPMSKENKLLTLANVCVLPHIGSATYEARNAMAIMASENIINYFRNGLLTNIANPNVLSR